MVCVTATSAFDYKFHVLWWRKYRGKVLTDDVDARLKLNIRQVCKESHGQAVETAVMPITGSSPPQSRLRSVGLLSLLRAPLVSIVAPGVPVACEAGSQPRWMHPSHVSNF